MTYAGVRSVPQILDGTHNDAATIVERWLVLGRVVAHRVKMKLTWRLLRLPAESMNISYPFGLVFKYYAPPLDAIPCALPCAFC